MGKEQAAQRVRSWTVQNEMRGAFGRMTTDAARRILKSANFVDARVVRCSKEERGHNKSGVEIPVS